MPRCAVCIISSAIITHSMKEIAKLCYIQMQHYYSSMPFFLFPIASTVLSKTIPARVKKDVSHRLDRRIARATDSTEYKVFFEPNNSLSDILDVTTLLFARFSCQNG
jgi:hypothetical protein